MHLFLFGLITFSLASFGYQSNLTTNGSSLRWVNKNIPLVIQQNSLTLSGTKSTKIIRNSINEWNQTTSAKLIESSSAPNQITFSQDYSVFGPGVVGLTELLYDESSGTIQKATVYLNENNFEFTATTGIQSSSRKIYLGDVVTHEFGHLFGLSHSEVLDSSMYYSAYPGQSQISADDKAGIRAKYDSPYGKIYGYVEGGNHIGVFGAHVQAISLKTGEMISGVSDHTGYFEIGGLNLNDSYYIYTSPLKKLDSLPSYFTNVQDSFCPASYVGSFFSACGKDQEGSPQKIHLSSAKKEVNIGIITINCTLRANEDYNYEKVQSTFHPVTIMDSTNLDPNHVSFVGYFRTDEVKMNSFSKVDKLKIDLGQFSDLGTTNKYLKVSLIGQPFGNPLEYTLDIKQDDVSQIGGALVKSVKVPEGTLKLDLSAIIPLSMSAAQNVFDLEIGAKKMTTEDLADSLPSASLYSSNQNFPYLVIASIWEDTLEGQQPYNDTEVGLSDNSSCLDAPFTYAVSNYKVQSNDSTESDATPQIAGCGTIEPPQGGGPSSSLPLLALGFFLTAVASHLMKSAKNFLS